LGGLVVKKPRIILLVKTREKWGKTAREGGVGYKHESRVNSPTIGEKMPKERKKEGRGKGVPSFWLP